MEQDEIELEEGELSDYSDNTYTPLERPAGYSASQPNPRFPTVVQDSDSEPELQSSDDSDSDSDCLRKKSKKVKIKLKPKKQVNPPRKRYDIWSTRVQEEVLAETLNSCDVTIKDRSRNVETYDYMSHRINNKRSREDRHNPNIKSVGRGGKTDEKFKGHSRKILDLNVDANNSPQEIATDIANKLSEEKEDLILKVIHVMGVDKTIEIFKETKKIEDEGGMLIMNQTRRRTPGGVFLFLVRHDYDITPDQKHRIFDEEKEKSKVALKKHQRQKMNKIKSEINASKEFLPDLLTRAELLAKGSNRVRKETEESDVINPPPTPETDNHDNSGDGMEVSEVRRKCESYDDDFLDIASNEMDLF